MPDTLTIPEVETLRADLRAIELDVTTSYTLADAIREGGQVTSKATGAFYKPGEACAMTAAVIAATARGYVT